MRKTYPPGPKGHWLLGSIVGFSKDSTGFLLRAAVDYGDISHMRLGPYHVYMINHPDLIHEVLITHKDKIRKGNLDRAIFSKFLGNGILVSEGEFHRRQRKLVQPAFHSKRIENYAQTMVDYTLRLMDGWRDGEAVDMEHAMTELTLHIVTKTLFDTEVTEGDLVHRVGAAISTLQRIANAEYKSAISLPEWLPIARNRNRAAAVKALNDVIVPIINERRASGEDRGDLLSMLLLAQDEATGERMDDRQVLDEATTLFSAGHETTANAMTWVWYLLSQHPEAEARLHEELETVLNGRHPTLADLKQLPYTDMVIKEVLRLYPPAWILNGRTPLERIEVGGYAIDRGDLIFISPYALHHHPRYFAEPERFMPERWTPEFEKALPRYAYLPFGGGPRVCIGNSFAMMEARLILATMAQRYRFSLVEGQQVETHPQITLSPKRAIQMRAQLREGASLQERAHSHAALNVGERVLE